MQPPSNHPPLILASSSVYRRQLLLKLNLSFDCVNPCIDETAGSNETADQLVARLAREKALAVIHSHPAHLIIASDQVAVLDGVIMTKPGDHGSAIAQLRQCSDKKVIFYTGLTLLNSSTGRLQNAVEPFSVYFRKLDATTIERYLANEKPYDCAGSFKVEGLGITLFKKLEGDDPNSLIGLPLIQLTSMLANEGILRP